MFCRQPGHCFLPCLLLLHRRTHKKNNSFKSRSNQITSRLNFPGWEKWQYWMFKSLYSVNYPYIKRLKCPLLISIQTLYIFWTTVLHANSHITLSRPVLTREPARRLTLSKPYLPKAKHELAHHDRSRSLLKLNFPFSSASIAAKRGTRKDEVLFQNHPY